MREIKFRAWCKLDNSMIKETKLEWMIYQKISTFSMKMLEKEMIFLQYTGLKDKSGIEIYEGDTVKIDAGFFNVIATIEFIEGCFVFVSVGNKDIGSLENSKEFEVIGNIYENKELLDDK